jgi:lactoylglutathione lyase
MPGKIVHIALKVKDMESSTKFYRDVFGFREVATHRGAPKNEPGHVSRHMTDGVIDLALMVYDSEDAPEAQLSGTGPCIHHWGAEVDDIKVAAEKIKELGGEIMSPLDAGVVKFRAPDGTIAELCQKDRYENFRKHHGVA